MRRGEGVALYGILISTAMILSFVESLLPAFFAVPGMKLGLANVVNMVALYLLGAVPALVIALIRVVLSSILFGSIVSAMYSLAGTLLCFAVMLLLKRMKLFSMTAVSIAGAVFHNVGQILVAMVLLTTNIIYYFVILWFTGIATGLAIGLISSVVYKRLPADIKIKGRLI